MITIYLGTVGTVIVGIFAGLALLMLAIGASLSIIGWIIGVPLLSILMNYIEKQFGQAAIHIAMIYLITSMGMVFPYLFEMNYTLYVSVFITAAAMLAAARKAEARSWSLATLSFAIVSFGSFIG